MKLKIMKNGKKLLSCIMAIAMVITMVPYTDVSADDTTAAVSPAAAVEDSIVLGEPQTVTISEPGEICKFYFTPKETKLYRFYSEGEEDTYGYLYDENGEEIISDDDGNEVGSNFQVNWRLEANTTYILGARLWNPEATGSFSVILEEAREWEYETLEDGNIAITAYNGIDTEVRIPAQLDGKQVTEIGESVFYDNDEITRVEFPNGLIKIGEYAFSDCDSLQEVQLPETLTSIGRLAFSWCIGLKEIMIPGQVTELAEEVFANCDNLAKFEVAQQNPAYSSLNGNLYDKEQTTLIKVASGEKVKENFTIPDTVQTVKTGAFSGCYIREIRIPASVKRIEEEGRTLICGDLQSITVADENTVYATKEGCLYNKAKTELLFYLFKNENREMAVIPDGTTKICEYAFYLWSGSVFVPNSVKEIEENAFDEDIYSITFYGEKGSYIEQYAKERGATFREMPSSISITTMPDKTKYGIGQKLNLTGLVVTAQYADSRQEKITENLIISELDSSKLGETSVTVTYINRTAKIPLEIVEDPENDFVLGEEKAVVKVGNKNNSYLYYMPEETAQYVLRAVGEHAENVTCEVYRQGSWIGSGYGYPDEPMIMDITLQKGYIYEFEINPYEGLVSLILEKKPEWGYEPLADGSVAITAYNGVNSNVVIPSELDKKPVTVIRTSAFENNYDLNEIEIPAGINTIEDGAFSACPELRYIQVSDNNKFYSSQDGSLYDKNQTKLLRAIPAEYGYASEFIIPDTVQTIGTGAFAYWNNLETIIIPAGVTSIGERAFYGCDNLRELSIAEENTAYLVENGCLYNKNKTELLLCFLSADGDEPLEIPDGVTKIAEQAFGRNTSISSIIVPASVKEIGENAFPSMDDIILVDFYGEKDSYIETYAQEHNATFNERPVSISVVRMPDKVKYGIGQKANLAGLQLKASYSDGREEIITSGSVFGKFNSSKLGETLLTVNYAGRTVEIPVEIVTDPGNDLILDEWKTFDILGAQSYCYFYFTPQETAKYRFSISENEGASWDISINRDDGDIIANGYGNSATGLLQAGMTYEFEVHNQNNYGQHKAILEKLPEWEYENLEDGNIAITAYNGTDTEVTVPAQLDGKTVTEIGAFAFSSCENLEKVTIPKEITKIALFALKGWFLSMIEVDDQNPVYSSLDGNLYNKDQSELLRYAIGKREAYFVVPETVKRIGSGAFSCPSGFGTVMSHIVEIPETVTDISDGAIGWMFTLSVNQGSYAEYYAKTHGCNYYVIPSEIRINTPPEKLIYGVGQGLNLTGLTLTARYADGTEEVITEGFTVSKFDSSKIGNSTLTVEYLRQKVSFSVQIVSEVEDDLILNEEKTITIPSENEKCYLYFTPKKTMKYEFQSIDPDRPTTGTVYDNTGSIIACYYGDDGIFSTVCTLEAGKTYKLETGFFYGIETGSYQVVVKEAKEWSYELLEDGTLELTRYNGDAEDLVIPKELDGKPVSRIASSAVACREDLKSIMIPASIVEIGAYAFNGCNNLTKISVDKQNPNYSSLDGSLYDKNQTMLIQYALGKSETAFTIPASVIGIGNSAFAGCSALSSVMIPENVEEIGAYAFDSCENLKVVSMEEGLKTIGDRAFWGCTNLGRITIPKSVYNITPEAFALKWDYESDQNCYVPVRVYEGSYAETQVSGTVTSYDKSTDAVILRLVDGTDEIDVIGTTGTAFEFTSVPAGSYTLEVSKKNHVTRTYEIEVDDADVTQNVKIHLLGDINGDGRVTAMDYGRALAHVQKLQTLTGYELQCADTNQNGSITAMDYAQILAHVQKVSLLW